MQYWIYKSQNASVINMEHSILFIQHGFDLAFTNYVKTINEIFLEIRICFIWMSAKISPNFNHHISTFKVDFVIFTDWFLMRLLCELFISSRANWKIYTSRHIVFYFRGIPILIILVIMNWSDLNHAECLHIHSKLFKLRALLICWPSWETKNQKTIWKEWMHVITAWDVISWWHINRMGN